MTKKEMIEWINRCTNEELFLRDENGQKMNEQAN